MSSTLKTRVLGIGLVAAATALLGGTALGGDARDYGTTAAPGLTHRQTVPPTAALKVKPFKTYSSASYNSGGVALRNRDRGVIHISGSANVVQDAYLYWAYLFSTTPKATQKITLDRLYPSGGPHLITLTGTLIGTSADPCWGSAGGAVYRAQVPTDIATGNGLYEVTLNATAVGLTTGEDPWDGNVVYPMSEGASLVIVTTGSNNVSIFDQPLTGNEFDTSFSYTLTLPAATTGSQALFDTIGADGQEGASRTANADGTAAADEEVTINRKHISGIGGTDPDSDWNGSSGWPLPQLWDDTGHDISEAVPSGTKSLAVTISNPTATKNSVAQDCLITVANVVAY